MAIILPDIVSAIIAAGPLLAEAAREREEPHRRYERLQGEWVLLLLQRLPYHLSIHPCELLVESSHGFSGLFGLNQASYWREE